MFSESTCSGVPKSITKIFCTHFWVNKSLSMMWGDTAASFFGEWQKSYRFKFLALFLWIGSESVRPSAVQWQLLHVEKDDQVIFWRQKRKASGKHSCSKHYWNIVLRKNICLFCWLGLVFITLCLLFLYYFCHSPKKLASVSPFRSY
jgi:hypothetical protein